MARRGSPRTFLFIWLAVVLGLVKSTFLCFMIVINLIFVSLLWWIDRICPINLVKEKLINLIEWTFKREGSPNIACNERQAFFTSEDTKRYKLWS